MEIIINNGVSKYRNLELVFEWEFSNSARYSTKAVELTVGQKYLFKAYCKDPVSLRLNDTQQPNATGIYQELYYNTRGLKSVLATIEQTENLDSELSPNYIMVFNSNAPTESVKRCVKIWKIVEE